MEFSTQASTSFYCVLTERNAGKATSFPGFSPTCHIPLRGRVEDSLGARERRKRYKVRHTYTTKKKQKQIKNKKNTNYKCIEKPEIKGGFRKVH